MVTPPTIEHSTKYDAFTSDEKAMLESLRKAGVSISFNDRAASYDVCVYCHIPRKFTCFAHPEPLGAAR